MADLQCPMCGTKFDNKRELFVHSGRWGCPVLGKALTELAAPLCACGCRGKVGLNKRNPSKFNRFIQGHNSR